MEPGTPDTTDTTDTNGTTEGITRQDVEEALEYLGIHNPKPEIPLEMTLTGHEIVGVFRCIQDIEEEIVLLQRLIEERTGATSSDPPLSS